MEEEKKNLLSIGKLSKLTGVNVKSLRYYDRLGILPPAYVDPESRYRYYDFSQVYMIEAIQLCVELDIPLRTFTDFLEDGAHEINYDRLLSFGIRVANRKIRSIQDKIAFLEEGKRQIERTKSIQEQRLSAPTVIPAHSCLVEPYEGTLTTQQCFERVRVLMQRATQLKMKPGYEVGLLSIFRSGGEERYVYVDVESDGQAAPEGAAILRIPQMRFVSVRTNESSIHRAREIFPAQFAENCDRMVMETDLFLGIYDTQMPKYELRCSAEHEKSICGNLQNGKAIPET